MREHAARTLLAFVSHTVQVQGPWQPSHMQRHGAAVFPEAFSRARKAVALAILDADEQMSSSAPSPAALPVPVFTGRPATSSGERDARQ
jgi:hypothetical protein